MSRAYNALGVLGAAACGYFIAKTTLEPELENEKAERLGETPKRDNSNDKVLSQAIVSDMKEAKQQVTHAQAGGFGWGIRQALFGKRDSVPSEEQPVVQNNVDTAAKDESKA